MKNNAAIRKALFTPCKNKQELNNWLKYFLDIHLPDCTVDPLSNSNPMDLMWEIYEKALDGKDPNFTELLLYSARSGYKTVFCALLVVLGLLHLRRSSCVLAAIEPQAQMTAKYVGKHFKRPYLRDHLGSKNRREIEAIWYEDKKGACLSPDEWGQLTLGKDQFVEKKYICQILVATMSGVNSPHHPLVILDELDLAPSGPLAEVKLVPDRGERGELPITFYTSSRKFAYGNVQKMLDNTTETGLNVRHWNIIDICEKCPEKRHRPDLPKLKVFRSDYLLKTLTPEEYEVLDDDKKKRYVEDKAYAGCVSNCRIFSSCRGMLATKQTSTSPFLKSIDSVQALFRSVDLEVAKSQMLCWKPSSEGMVYSRLEFDKNCITAAQMAQMVTGENYSYTFNKDQLLNLLRSNERVRFFAGMDYGFTDAFAVVVAAVFGSKVFILEAHEIEGLELQDMVNFCQQKIKPYDPEIFADTANPGYIKTFRRHKFKMRQWNKGPDSLLEGVTAVRTKISPVIGETELFFLKGDSGAEHAYRRLASYHWQTNIAGETIEKPEHDESSHVADSIRYMIMNVFPQKSKTLVSTYGNEETPNAMQSDPLSPQNYLQTLIEEALAESPATNEESFGQKGKIKWTF